MKCLNCGCDLPSSAKFCPKCGNKVILEETIDVNMMERQEEQDIQEKDEIEDAQGECQKQLENSEEDKTNREEYNNKGAFTWKKQYTYLLIGMVAIIALVIFIAVKITENKFVNSKNISMETNSITEIQQENGNQDADQISKYMNEYVAGLPSEDAYYAVKDINMDGVDELIYRRNQDYVSYLTVFEYVSGNMQTILELEYEQYSGELALCNGNELTLIENMDDLHTVSYYKITDGGYQKIEIQQEINYEENSSTFLLNGKDCSTEQFNYYNVTNDDWINFNHKYPEERYVKSVEKLIFYENTEQGRKRGFENQLCFSGYDEALLKNLIGIIGYMENEGIYTTGSEVSPQDWSDEAKLEFMDYLIGSGLADDSLVISLADISCLNQLNLDILQSDVDYTYYAMRVNDMNNVLENVIGVNVNTQISTELAQYYEGYFIFKVGQFIDWIPYSEFDEETIQSVNNEQYTVYAETGIGVFDYNESIEIPCELEGNDIRHFRNVYMEKNTDSVCTGVEIIEWSAENTVEIPMNDYSAEKMATDKVFNLEDYYGICINDAVSLVDDEANILQPEEVENILEHAEHMSEISGYNIMIVTTYDDCEEGAREYADNYYDTVLENYRDQYSLMDDGYVFVINMNIRECTLSTCGKAIENYTDQKIDEMLDDIVPKVSDGYYEDAIIQFVDHTIY